MDNAVGIVEAYLHINGYFTVTEYPIVEHLGSEAFRTVTDLDILAVRFPGSGRLVPSRHRDRHHRRHGIFKPDPMLACEHGRVDMIVGEVKEGRAALNKRGRDPAVMKAALVRFGCCPFEKVEDCVERLLARGEVDLPSGHRARLVAFGTSGHSSHGVRVVKLQHVLEYISSYLDDSWDILKHADYKTSALGFLATLRKAAVGASEKGTKAVVE